ncbi:hypothetical protein J2S36_001171 [Arcanobacterium hippocoleae]|uniref:Uncharacterized protein n=2 Tax=Arcanobacterium hippocoleae TaxID=149017 RepID=A0ABU1T2S8_9ACTO|nr:hypothetical protein [Arcanobacterium hippocoleae]
MLCELISSFGYRMAISLFNCLLPRDCEADGLAWKHELGFDCSHFGIDSSKRSFVSLLSDFATDEARP